MKLQRGRKWKGPCSVRNGIFHRSIDDKRKQKPLSSTGGDLARGEIGALGAFSSDQSVRTAGRPQPSLIERYSIDEKHHRTRGCSHKRPLEMRTAKRPKKYRPARPSSKNSDLQKRWPWSGRIQAARHLPGSILCATRESVKYVLLGEDLLKKMIWRRGRHGGSGSAAGDLGRARARAMLRRCCFQQSVPAQPVIDAGVAYIASFDRKMFQVYAVLADAYAERGCSTKPSIFQLAGAPVENCGAEKRRAMLNAATNIKGGAPKEYYLRRPLSMSIRKRESCRSGSDKNSRRWSERQVAHE